MLILNTFIIIFINFYYLYVPISKISIKSYINQVFCQVLSTIVNKGIMSFLEESRLEIESYPDTSVQKEYRSAYLTIISFLKFVDDGSSFTEKYLKDRFSHREHYRIMLDKMISNSILLKSGKGSYVLNLKSRNPITAVFDDSMVAKNKNSYNYISDLGPSFIYA